MYAPTRRWVSGSAYALFVLVGLITFAFPLTTITSVTAFWVTIVWSLALVVGGTLCVMGAIRRREGYEFVGLPVLSSAVCVFGIVLIGRGMLGATTSVWGAILVGMLMLALSLKLLARWLDIGALVRALSRRTDGEK